MRCKPFGICGIPGKTTTKLVIDSTINHFIEGKAGMIKCFLRSRINNNTEAEIESKRFGET